MGAQTLELHVVGISPTTAALFSTAALGTLGDTGKELSQRSDRGGVKGPTKLCNPTEGSLVREIFTPHRAMTARSVVRRAHQEGAQS